MRENWFCPHEKCEHYLKATKYPRKCYYGEPQCWKGWLDLIIGLIILRFRLSKTEVMAIENKGENPEKIKEDKIP